MPLSFALQRAVFPNNTDACLPGIRLLYPSNFPHEISYFQKSYIFFVFFFPSHSWEWGNNLYSTPLRWEQKEPVDDASDGAHSSSSIKPCKCWLIWWGCFHLGCTLNNGCSGWSAWIKSLGMKRRTATYFTYVVPSHRSKVISLWPKGYMSVCGGLIWEAPAGPMGQLWCQTLYLSPLQGHMCYRRAPHRRRRQVPESADWWGQQTHSLKRRILREGRASWVSASAHSTIPRQTHTIEITEGHP